MIKLFCLNYFLNNYQNLFLTIFKSYILVMNKNFRIYYIVVKGLTI
jgi:hypothetical protein